MQCPSIWTTDFLLVLHGIEECFTLLCKVLNSLLYRPAETQQKQYVVHSIAVHEIIFYSLWKTEKGLYLCFSFLISAWSSFFYLSFPWSQDMWPECVSKRSLLGGRAGVGRLQELPLSSLCCKPGNRSPWQQEEGCSLYIVSGGLVLPDHF